MKRLADTFKELSSMVNYKSVVGIIVICSTGYIIYDWVGLVLGIFLSYILSESDGGLQIYEEETTTTEQTCSKKIEGCKICNNPYTHEFNEAYKKKHNLWKKILKNK